MNTSNESLKRGETADIAVNVVADIGRFEATAAQERAAAVTAGARPMPGGEESIQQYAQPSPIPFSLDWSRFWNRHWTSVLAGFAGLNAIVMIFSGGSSAVDYAVCALSSSTIESCLAEVKSHNAPDEDDNDYRHE